MWTQRTGAAAALAPAASSRSSSSSRLWTVSTWLLADDSFLSRSSRAAVPAPSGRAPVHLVPGLGEDAVEDVVDLFELLGVGDQRRRQLHHRVAAIVGAADQTALVELAGEEAAQQPLGLLVVEALFRFLVFDQL